MSSLRRTWTPHGDFALFHFWHNFSQNNVMIACLGKTGRGDTLNPAKVNRMALGFFGALPVLLIAVIPSILGRHSLALPQGQPANRPWMDKTLPPDRRAELVLKEMTL